MFGFSKLDVMFGERLPAAVLHPYRDIVKPGVRFVRTTIRSIDPLAKRVETDAGAFRRRHHGRRAWGLTSTRRPRQGWSKAGTSSTPCPAPSPCATCWPDFKGGRVIVGVTSTPFKCPPAPSETALLLHDYLTERGFASQSEISLVMPLGVPIPPSPAASEALLVAFAERGISWHPERLVDRSSTRPQGGRAQRRDRDALRPLPRRSPCTGRRPWWRSRAWPSTGGSR